jgi:uridine kinase
MTTVPIIAISGHPGGGKTSLTKALRDRLGVPALHYDDYETFTSRPPREVRDWIERGSNYDDIPLHSLVREMMRLSEMVPPATCVLLDTLLGRAHRETGKLIHTAIWIDTPPDIALARKIREAAARARATAGQAPAFVEWLDSYLGHYAEFIAGTYIVQRERVRPLADIVLDGRASLATLAEEAVSTITRRLGL